MPRRLLYFSLLHVLRRGPDAVAHFDILGHIHHHRQLAVVAQHEAVTDHRHEGLGLLAIGAGHQCAGRAADLVQAVVAVAPAFQGTFLQAAAQALAVAVDLQALAGEDFQLVGRLIGLGRQVDDLPGEAFFRLGVGRDVLQAGS
ncbi:hypothetical protein D3C77_612420 [compost metagenome]